MMTALLGFLLLLCVGYSYQQNTGLFRDAAGQIVPYALRSGYTKPAIVNGVKDPCYRNFTNLLLYKYTQFFNNYRVTDIHTCDALCKHTHKCAKFQLVTGVEYPRGCTLFTSCAEGIIAPLYTGDTICDVNADFKGCVERDVSYSYQHRIYILKEKNHKYPQKQTGLAGCQERCRTYSGQNGFLLEDVDWKLSDNQTLQGAASGGRVPCKYFTFYKANVQNGFCLMFTKGAISSQVTKIAGPSYQCEKDRLKNLEDAITSPDFQDYKGAFYSKKYSVGYEKSIVYPDKCKEECQKRNECSSFISVIGMPFNSGCYMFKKGATQERIDITTGWGNCSAPDCRTDDYTYGHTYEIVLRDDYKFTGSSLDDCQSFCKNHNGDSRGFRFHEVWWDKTGAAQKFQYFYRCSYFTYIHKDIFGKKQCIVFAGEPKPQKIIFRGSTV